MHKLLRYTLITVPAFFSLVLPLAAAESMGLQQVIEAVLDRHPDMSISRTDTALNAVDQERIEGLLNANINASIGASTEQSPVASDFQAIETRTGQMTAGLSLPLANGGTLGVQTSYTRRGQDFNSPFAAQLARFNPDYRSQVDITYRHALLRGSGRPDYAYGLQSVEEKTAAARLNEHIVARTLALSALNAFYQLAADDINVAIAEQAVKRARELLRYQKSRQSFGLIEQADTLQAEALLAARRTDRQRAVSQRSTDNRTLTRLMLLREDQPIVLRLPSATSSSPLPDLGTAEQQALAARPDLKALDAQISAAQADLAVAQDINRMQLDIVAQVGTRALNSNAGPAAASGLSANDRFASLSLEMQDTPERSSAHAAIRRAELAHQRLHDQRRQTLERIRDELAAAITAIKTGIPTLRLARQQADAEQRKYQAELERYREGRSDTATLVQFEGELRNAQLQARLQRLTLQLARTQLAWARGELLAELGVDFAGDDAREGNRL